MSETTITEEQRMALALETSTNEEIVLVLNDFVSLFNFKNTLIVERILDDVLGIPDGKFKLKSVASHQLFQLISDHLIYLLQQWHHSTSPKELNMLETSVFSKIVCLFQKMIHGRLIDGAADDEDKEGEQKMIERKEKTMNDSEYMEIWRSLFAKETLLTLVTECVDDIVSRQTADRNIETFGCLMGEVILGYQYYLDGEETPVNGELQLLTYMKNLVLSDCYTTECQTILLSEVESKSKERDQFLLDVCIRCLFYNGYFNMKDTQYCPMLVKRCEERFDTVLATNQKDNDELLTKVSVRRTLQYGIDSLLQSFIRPAWIDTFSKMIDLKIVDHLFFILNSKYLIDRIEAVDDDCEYGLSTVAEDKSTPTVLLATTIEYLYKLLISPNQKVLYIVRSYKETFLSLIHSECRPIQAYAYHCLAHIMSEDDIKQLSNAQEITAIFISYLKQASGHFQRVSCGGELTDLLKSLKALAQHDQIKNELIQQGGLQLVKKFSEVQPGFTFDDDYSRRLSLEVIWSLLFNTTAVENLRQDYAFREYMKSILADSDKPADLKKAAEGVLWKLEKEEEFKKQKEQEDSNDQPYDLMISYSWADQKLVLKIYEYLTSNKSYRIWLDKNEMHGSTLTAMANAIEQSEFIIMCMSDTYKRSPNCQSEAEYAFQRRRPLIPLVMREKYKPDGWLGFLAGSRMYVDFGGKHDFETAMQLLVHEIELNRKKQHQLTAMHVASETEKAATARVDLPSTGLSTSTVIRTPADVPLQSKTATSFRYDSSEQLTEENVVEYLSKNDLTPMIPLCHKLNGQELVSLHKLCIQQTKSMYDSLKHELSELHQQVLPIGVYLRFIHRFDTKNVDATKF